MDCGFNPFLVETGNKRDKIAHPPPSFFNVLDKEIKLVASIPGGGRTSALRKVVQVSLSMFDIVLHNTPSHLVYHLSCAIPRYTSVHPSGIFLFHLIKWCTVPAGPYAVHAWSCSSFYRIRFVTFRLIRCGIQVPLKLIVVIIPVSSVAHICIICNPCVPLVVDV